MGGDSLPVRTDTGSLHDPTSRVFDVDGTIIRGLRGDAVDAARAVLTSDFLQQAVADGDCVASQWLDPLPDLPGGFDAALSHPRIAPITYPNEWTFSMLRDAALLQLRLARAAVAEGFTTKDATPFNIQFVGSHPRFIDLGSFEPLGPGSPWLGYRQFCELFLNPLLVQAHTGVAARQLLRGSVRGLSPADTRRTLPLRTRMRPAVFTHVSLHARLQRRFSGTDDNVAADLRAAGMGPAVINNQLRQLERLVGSLTWKPRDSTWSGYSTRSHYDDADLARKMAFVAEVAGTRSWDSALDLGANDGAFVEPLRPHAERITAVDGDELVVDDLYRRLRAADDTQVTPLCIDLADPGGGLGWDGRQRLAAYDRLAADLVVCLALVHHVVIGDSIPMESFIATLGRLGGTVVCELPLPDDPKVRRLIRNKAGQPTQPYSPAEFEQAATAVFDIVRSETLPSGLRRLYHLTRR